VKRDAAFGKGLLSQAIEGLPGVLLTLIGDVGPRRHVREAAGSASA